MNTTAPTRHGPLTWPAALRLAAFAALVSVATFGAVALALPTSNWLGVGFTMLGVAMALQGAGIACVSWGLLGGWDRSSAWADIAGLIALLLMLAGGVLTFIVVGENPFTSTARFNPTFP